MQTVDCTLVWHSVTVSRFAHELRVNLWLEHLGLTSSEAQQLRDPVHRTAYHDMWQNTSTSNSDILNQVFPEDKVALPTIENRRDLARFRYVMVQLQSPPPLLLLLLLDALDNDSCHSHTIACC
jgi:hypothetical protein